MDNDPYSDYGLRSVESSDRQAIEPFFSSLAQPLSDYTFSQLYTWRNSLHILWTILHGNLCVFANGSDDLTMLMPPIGDSLSEQALAAAFELMDDYNAAEGVPGRSRVEYASEELLARISSGDRTIAPMGADYVYDVQSMIDLAGAKLASKRQAKNRFLRNYEHCVEQYQPALHQEECHALLESWKVRQDERHEIEDDSTFLKRKKETAAANLTLSCAPELGIQGMVVRVKTSGGWPIAGFTFGEVLGGGQSSIIIEKTDLAVKGLAQFIFSEFCRQYWADRLLVNVGDDWGLESLSWTKNSYRPVKMLRKYCLRKLAAVRVAFHEPTAKSLKIAEPVGAA
jgi:hypothetical protein